MQTKNTALIDLLGTEGARYVIPSYQRAYTWEERQCKELWLDIARAARSGDRHFVGTLLYAADDVDQGSRRIVVDGQQRLTTLTLLLIALVRHLEEKGTAADRSNAAKIRTRYLIAANDDAISRRCVDEDDRAPAKLVLSRGDRATLDALVNEDDLPARPSARIVSNLSFFTEQMDREDFDAEILWRGISALHVIEALVSRDDDAQLIFESLNSKGAPLTTADLVRNYLLLSESHAEQTRLYDEYWAPIEGMFAPDPGSLRLDNAIQGWLSVRFPRIRARGAAEVYSVFKQYVEDEFEGTTESLLAELRNFSLVWAENYRYHAVKKYRSSFDWATNGAKTLVSHLETKQAANPEAAEKIRRGMNAVDESL